MTAVLLTKPCSVHFVVGTVRLVPETGGGGGGAVWNETAKSIGNQNACFFFFS